MAAILRVKRRNDDEPLEALVIACKRRKTAENDEPGEPVVSPPRETVLKFAGTVKSQEDDIVEHLVKTLGKDDLKKNFKRHPVDVVSKAREQAKQTSAENRYKVVNCFRSLDTSNVEELEEKVMTVIDVEDSLSCSAKPDSNVEEDNSYVYDLYYAKTDDDVYIDDMVLVSTMDMGQYFGTYRNGDASENECESEDSNSESNWRNDYPDSDHSERSIDEDDMREAVMNVKLNSESDLSSEDDFVYAVDEEDVEHYGYKYAKYKARIKEELGEDNSSASEYSGVCVSEDSDDSDSSNRKYDE